MKYTVFTPTFNRGGVLHKLYDSLVQQSYKDFEWLIVDDGSTDGTDLLCKNWCKENVIPITYRYKENGGKHTAINLGAQFARGEYFFIVDSDDYLVPNALELIDKYVETIKYKNQFAGVVGLRGKADGSAWTGYYGTSTREKGLQELKKEYIDATSFEYRYKFGIQGDRAEVVRTEIIKSHPFPVFDNEKFITEGILWSKLSVEGYKFRWFNSIIYITEYRDDGLTKNIGNAYLNSPKGASYYSNFLCGQKSLPFKERFRNEYNYYRYGFKAKCSIMTLLRNNNWKQMTLPGIILALIRPK